MTARAVIFSVYFGMKRPALILFLSAFYCIVVAQNVEVARFEMPLSTKSQQCSFVPLAEQGAIALAESASSVKGAKNWDFIVLDTNLVEQNSFSTQFDAALQLHSSATSDEFAVVLFTTTKRADSTHVSVVVYDREKGSFSSFSIVLPPNITLLPAAAVSHTLLLAYNINNGGSVISFYDVKAGKELHVSAKDSNYLIQDIEAHRNSNSFVVTMKEFVERHSVATGFLVFTSEGTLTKSFSYPNGNTTTIGRSRSRMCLDGSLEVFVTVERIGGGKVSAKNFADNFGNESVGIGWINFSNSATKSKIYLFKDIPDIDKALTPGSRLRVKQRQVQRNDTVNNRVEIAFQFLKPSLLAHNDTSIMALEAFIPVYHTETRMEFGYYGSIPTTYTVFDGYDFYSQILFAFNDEGLLLWHNYTNFDNPIDEALYRHTSEAICNGEVILISSDHNTLTYSVMDMGGRSLLDNESTTLPLMRQNDMLESEYNSNIRLWYDNKFIVFGRQILKNRMMRKADRFVFFLQKTQYE